MATKETKNQAIALTTDQLPAHAQQGQGLGNENVGAADMIVPRLKLLQDLSPEVKKSKPQYIEGAEPGLIYNTVTKKLSNEIYAVNLYYDHEYVLFRNRDFGGGFFGSFPNQQSAWEKAVAEAGNEDTAKKMFDIVESGRHTVGIIDTETGEVSPAIMEFTSTKLRVSAQWNTNIEQSGGDRFSSIWKITAEMLSNDKGDYYNYRIDRVGYASDAIYEGAKEKYFQIRDSYAAGTAKVVD